MSPCYQLNHAYSTKRNFGSGDQPTQDNSLWQRFKSWFMEPIDFPGKLPNEEIHASEYNLIRDESTQQTSDVNERQPPQSR
jgi:hypothetical protein